MEVRMGTTWKSSLPAREDGRDGSRSRQRGRKNASEGAQRGRDAFRRVPDLMVVALNDRERGLSACSVEWDFCIIMQVFREILFHVEQFGALAQLKRASKGKEEGNGISWHMP